jgi:predicted nuclease of predicted toxin-antitoxin system
VRFLVDAQLPPALARWLTAQGHDAHHVFDLDLHQASDRAIWAEAVKSGAAILSKDEDFITLATLEPKGPQVVWVRAGNTTTRALLEWMTPLLPTIVEALERGEKVIEITKG